MTAAVDAEGDSPLDVQGSRDREGKKDRPLLSGLADSRDLSEVARLVEVVHTLRERCPWDARQTARSLVPYLIEETAEAVEAIEEADREHMVEELGDLLFEVLFQTEIAGETGLYTLADLASGVADKLISRHPWVFGGQDAPEDVLGTWEKNKVVEKSRASALDDIPSPLSALARANKVVTRIRRNDIDVPLDDEPVSAFDVGQSILALVARAHAAGIDPEQALRDAVRDLEVQARAVESAA
ncbi:MAG: nucleoside triphosphate pyrophosphohydrolase [Propionibacteriaceae bacterium]|nr:nucleoside triphosphate pyrophosphohydrolase [Propionibacteriaceae bacterium]